MLITDGREWPIGLDAEHDDQNLRQKSCVIDSLFATCNFDVSFGGWRPNQWNPEILVYVPWSKVAILGMGDLPA